MALSSLLVLLGLLALAHSSGALPMGAFTGTVNIVPYTQTGSYYQCLTQCSYVSAPATLIWSGSTVYINISAARNPQGCSVGAQTYTINNVVVHTRFPYYAGMFSVQAQTFPVCFVFDGTQFVLTVDGAGTCPLQTAPPSCTQVGSAVAQVWTGSFLAIPAGVWKGSLTVAPYSVDSAGYHCLAQCSAITSQSVLTWSYNTLRVDITGGVSPQGCTLSQQSYLLTEVTFHAQYYYGGMFHVGAQTIPICMYFPGNGAFVITLDGRGSCPPASASASCFPGPGSTVIQTWTGFYTRVGETVSSRGLIINFIFALELVVWRLRE